MSITTKEPVPKSLEDINDAFREMAQKFAADHGLNMGNSGRNKHFESINFVVAYHRVKSKPR